VEIGSVNDRKVIALPKNTLSLKQEATASISGG